MWAEETWRLSAAAAGVGAALVAAVVEEDAEVEVLRNVEPEEPEEEPEQEEPEEPEDVN